MTPERLTVRFDEREMATITALSEALGRPKADVIRLAVEALAEGGAKKMEHQLAKLSENIEQANQKSAVIDGQIRKSFALLFRLINAPKEAEDALKKVWGLS